VKVKTFLTIKIPDGYILLWIGDLNNRDKNKYLLKSLHI